MAVVFVDNQFCRRNEFVKFMEIVQFIIDRSPENKNANNVMVIGFEKSSGVFNKE